MFNGERKVIGAEARHSRLRFDRFCLFHPLPCKAIPAKNDTEAFVRGRSGHDKAKAAVGAYLRVSGP